jgi:hypothetical protein
MKPLFFQRGVTRVRARAREVRMCSRGARSGENLPRKKWQSLGVFRQTISQLDSVSWRLKPHHPVLFATVPHPPRAPLFPLPPLVSYTDAPPPLSLPMLLSRSASSYRVAFPSAARTAAWSKIARLYYFRGRGCRIFPTKIAPAFDTFPCSETFRDSRRQHSE